MKNLGLLSIMFVGIIGAIISSYGLVIIEDNYEQNILFTTLIIIFSFSTISAMIVDGLK
jgi:hypothetical protein